MPNPHGITSFEPIPLRIRPSAEGRPGCRLSRWRSPPGRGSSRLLSGLPLRPDAGSWGSCRTWWPSPGPSRQAGRYFPEYREGASGPGGPLRAHPVPGLRRHGPPRERRRPLRPFAKETRERIRSKGRAPSAQLEGRSTTTAPPPLASWSGTRMCSMSAETRSPSGPPNLWAACPRNSSAYPPARLVWRPPGRLPARGSRGTTGPPTPSESLSVCLTIRILDTRQSD